MSPPKKGKDLSALKARLAKKSGAPEEEAAAVPAPGEVLEAPPEPEPEPEPEPAPPAADEAAPMEEAPAYDEPAAEAPAAAPAYDEPVAAASSPAPDFSAYEGGDVDVGDIKPRKSMGLVLVAGLAALAVGTAAGYLLGVANSKKGNLAMAKSKRADLAAEITAIKDARARVSLGIADIKKTIGEDPAKGGEAVGAVLAKLEGSPDPAKLFGWQLAYVDPERVKRVLMLYRDAHGLKADLEDLKGLLDSRAADLASSAAPLKLAVVAAEGGANLVALGRPICQGEGGPAPCKTPEEAANAIGFEVRDDPTGEPRVVEKAQLRPLTPAGGIYTYAIESTPARKAFDAYAAKMQAVEGRLEAMAAVEKFACKAFKDDGACPGMEEG